MKRKHHDSQRGAAITEYCLMLGLLGAAATTFFEGTLGRKFNETSLALFNEGGGTESSTSGGTGYCMLEMARNGECYLPPCEIVENGYVLAMDVFLCDPGPLFDNHGIIIGENSSSGSTRGGGVSPPSLRNP